MTIQYRKDYVAPHYQLEKTALDFTLNPTKTIVKSKLSFKNVDTSKPLLLNGQYMELLDIKMDGQVLDKADYSLDDKSLTLLKTKPAFDLEISVQINPEANTRLMGLYMSNGMFCTQCEPEGFRNITYYPDHSDVPSKFIVTIHANRKKYPVLLSNGNKIKDEGDTVVFEDPFNKPCYLFALVAGNLDSLHDTFKTMSGKTVQLGLYCERGKKDRLSFAMESIKKAMAWDEKVFGLEYDLDSFNIVAVSHFNAGAMENKSLNIFNDAALLASKDTATDAIFEYVERVIAHEYFHNYSGDRVTLRDWFDLSLKEGFTVFRDSEFSYDVRSRAVARIDDVIGLRASQFPEDDGPLAHPVRPDSYQEIENFYTSTVYEKGAELIRMQKAIVGDEKFMTGCALYFKRHDGQAVTIDDFVKAIEDASGYDLTQFKRWYSTAGRPTVKVLTDYDENTKTYKVLLKQYHKTSDEPFVIPLHYGLLTKEGAEIKTGTFVLNQTEQEFVFENMPQKPVLSINRFFTAPIDLDITYSDSERICLMSYDTDLFNRYEIGHQYALSKMLDMIEHKSTKPDQDVIRVMGRYLSQPDLDLAFMARAIGLPTEEELADKMATVDIQAIQSVRKIMRQAFAETYKEQLLKLYHDNQSDAPYSPDTEPAAKRAIKNMALGYLALTDAADMVYTQYQVADNLTDRLAALSILINNDLPHKQEALDDFYQRYEKDDLVLNKWFALQARTPTHEALKIVQKLIQHPKFDYKNPNKARAVLGAFSTNMQAFHNIDGSGYAFFAKQCALIDKLNPHLSARLLTAFSRYKKFPEANQKQAQIVLEGLLRQPDLSTNAKETIERML